MTQAKFLQYMHIVLTLAGTIGVPALASSFVTTHSMLYFGLVSASVILHALSPSIFGGPSAADQAATGAKTSSLILILLGLGLMAPARVNAQATLPASVYAAGSSYSPGGSPSIAGTGLYAHLISGNCTATTTATGTGTVCKPTYAFTAYDVLPVSVSPFKVATNLSAGIAQQVFSINSVNVFIPASGGITSNGTNTSWNFTGGVLVDYVFKKNGQPTHWHLMPNARWIGTGVTGSTNFQITGGLLLGLDQ